MYPLKIIIIENEVEIIKKLRQKIDSFLPKGLHIVATASSVTEAYPLIIQYQPDLVFFDLDQSKEGEFDLFDRLSKLNFKAVVMISKKLTRFKANIVKKMKLSIVDYFLKPIGHQDLAKVDKILHLFVKNKVLDNRRVRFATSEGTHVVPITELLRFEGKNGYTCIFSINNRPIIKSINIGKLKENLPRDTFFQPHKSHIINKYHVISYTKKYILMSDGTKIPIARGKYWEFIDFMNEDDDDLDGDDK